MDFSAPIGVEMEDRGSKKAFSQVLVDSVKVVNT